jgi:hypothetical protein
VYDGDHGLADDAGFLDYRPDDVLPNYLEADQLAAQTSRPVPRAPLSLGIRAGLWALRGYVAVVGVMVIYVFIAQLGH